MIYTEFTEIPFLSRAKVRLRQIYCVLYHMQNGLSHTEAIHRTVEQFPQVSDYTTIQDKCGRRFAGDTPTFLEWHRSGVMLKKLIEINELGEHDARIFAELLGSSTLPKIPRRGQKRGRRVHPKVKMGEYAVEVDTAFEIVLEEIENAVEGLNKDGAKAFEGGEYEHVRLLRRTGTQMTEFRDKVYSLQKEWNSIFVPDAKAAKRKPSLRTRRRRLSQGLRTREEAFRIPILCALVKLGGSSPSTAVIKEIRTPMKPILNQYDLSRLSSSGVLRWENTAHWARHEMVKEGLLAADSPRGIWEISQKGRQWLTAHDCAGVEQSRQD